MFNKQSDSSARVMIVHMHLRCARFIDSLVSNIYIPTTRHAQSLITLYIQVHPIRKDPAIIAFDVSLILAERPSSSKILVD